MVHITKTTNITPIIGVSNILHYSISSNT
jgi:hypothetical protein